MAQETTRDDALPDDGQGVDPAPAEAGVVPDPDSSPNTSDGGSALNTDNDGNLIDPPVIRSFERDMAEAADAGDVDRMAAIQSDYDDARRDLAQRQADREAENNG